MHVEAGVTTGTVHRLARENGLRFPPDPGAWEQSQIGGNIATNAGGPHAFKYGVTGRWVMGLEAVVAPGELVELGGAVRKDVAGYDLRSLLVGSEGTLGIVTAAWLRLIPAPERRVALAGFYPSVEAGCAAIEAVMGSGVVPAAVEFVDGDALAIMDATGHPLGAAGHRFAVIAEADGGAAEVAGAAAELRQALDPGAAEVVAAQDGEALEAVWEWRRAVSHAVVAWRGGKIGEDIAVPVDRLAEAVEGTAAIGRRHELPTCSYGHAGDGNVHASLLVGRDDGDGHRRARAACEELFALAVELGGTVSGEHGVGVFKNGQLRRQWSPRAVELHRAVKAALDPANLFNPGKKLA
jgi:FAD/FMN-containing dehydrogenase